MINTTIFERMKKYYVPAKNPEDFLNNYTKGGYGAERGNDYQKARIESAYEDLEKCGYCMLSMHESKTGEVLTWYPN